MKRLASSLLAVAGVTLLVFGLGCLNYTKAGGLEHHRQFAMEHGLPQPSETILRIGAAALALGAGLIGYTIGSAQCSRRGPHNST